MTDSISLTIDGITVTAQPGTTLLKAAAAVGIDIPTICFHDYCTANALCRFCVVEVEGSRTLVPACVAKISEGMKVKTQSDRVLRARRTILEMLAATVDLSDSPEIQAYISEYTAQAERFPGAEQRVSPVLDDNPMYIRDYSKCILCWRCVQVCAEDAQYTYAINFTGRGFETQIGTFFAKPMPETTCVFCGQCVGVCPTGALKAKRQWLLEQSLTPDEIMSLTRTERRRKRREVSSEQGSASGG
ncbi:NAD-dependent formate dehydrogenase iron-sulfur protein [Longilinea arvoryzae]|uniref:NAD-dependent formate dehydrogenase iron-sulfur protein n=1 Tax=Longilinea arvoryzae TaxID=360412 RepID=A0A0S7BFM9_9CHLR|nr:2Fe-2S iron-sulfur cluster-binding protein [Longilinea arvoryzae]GAP14297.1 NAD-dependent formate dehydrogenase iron-sulfur protein [Longilinea arvoryzae]